MKKLQILNLEDNPNDSELIKEMLEDGGIECEITRVETEEDFLAACDKGGFDIILADYNLPSYDGLAALTVARERCPDPPFIFVSGKMGEDVAVESLKSGATDYILKNNFRRLVPSVRRALKEAELRTERKQADEEMRRMNALMDSVIENIPNVLFVKDARDLRFIRFNRAGENLLCYSRGDLLGKNDYDFFPKDQADFFTEKDRDVLRGKDVVDIPEEPVLTRYKGERIMHTKKVPILGANGEAEYLLGISEDITERKHKEDALRKAVNGIIQAMTLTVETRDPYTSGHQTRVARLAEMIALEMNLSQDKVEGIKMAAAIHDIGKISVPAEILSKPSKLTDIEFQLIQVHPEAGYNIVKDIEFPWPIAKMIRQHHERINGSGYPQGLKGEEIIPETKILSVADVVEAIASHRPYRPAYGLDIALKEISDMRGILYDTAVVDACLRLFKEKGFKLE
jgi:PAS domain S-box-containing protein/putative nucleotidyltransferase with HDIG domain